jgi:hypothetical protein
MRSVFAKTWDSFSSLLRLPLSRPIGGASSTADPTLRKPAFQPSDGFLKDRPFEKPISRRASRATFRFNRERRITK